MLAISSLDVLIIGLLLIFVFNIVAILTTEDIGVLVTVIGAVCTLVGYAFVRPILVRECDFNGG